MSQTQRQFRCELCNVRSEYSEKALKEHTGSASHRHMRLFLDEGLWPGTQKDCPTKILEPQMFKFGENGKIGCEACRVDLDNATHLLGHQMQPSHARSAANFDHRHNIPTLYYCSACDLCTGTKLATFQIHLASSSHAVLAGVPLPDAGQPASRSSSVRYEQRFEQVYDPAQPTTTPEKPPTSRNSGGYGSYQSDARRSRDFEGYPPKLQVSPPIPVAEPQKIAEPVSLDDANIASYLMSKMSTKFPWLNEKIITALVQRKKLRDTMSTAQVQPELVALVRSHYNSITLNIQQGIMEGQEEYLKSKGVYASGGSFANASTSPDAIEAAITLALEPQAAVSTSTAPTDMDLASDGEDEFVLPSGAGGRQVPAFQNDPTVNTSLMELMQQAAAEKERSEKSQSSSSSQRDRKSRDHSSKDKEDRKKHDRSHKRAGHHRSRSRSKDRRRRSRSRSKERGQRHTTKATAAPAPEPYLTLYKEIQYAFTSANVNVGAVDEKTARDFQIVMGLCTDDERQKLLRIVLAMGAKKLMQLSTDKKYNSILTTFFLHCNDDQKLKMAHLLFQNFVKIAFNRVGSEVLQQLFSSIGIAYFVKENEASIADVIKGKVSSMVYTTNPANFVIKELLANGTAEQIKAILTDLFDFPSHKKDLPSDSQARAKHIRQCLNLLTVGDKMKLMALFKSMPAPDVTVFTNALSVNDGALMQFLLMDQEACVVVEAVWDAIKMLPSAGNQRQKLFSAIPRHKSLRLSSELMESNPTGRNILLKITGLPSAPTGPPPGMAPPVQMGMPQNFFPPAPMGFPPQFPPGMAPPWAQFGNIPPQPFPVNPMAGIPPANYPGVTVEAPPNFPQFTPPAQGGNDMMAGAPLNADAPSYSDMVTKVSPSQKPMRVNDKEAGEKLFKMKGSMLSLATDPEGSRHLCQLISVAPRGAVQMVFDQLCQPKSFMPVVTSGYGVNVLCCLVNFCAAGERSFLIEKLLGMHADAFVRLVMEGCELVKELLTFKESENKSNNSELLFIQLIKIANENQDAVQVIGPLLSGLDSVALVRLVSKALRGRSLEMIITRNAGTIVNEVFNRASERQRNDIILEVRSHLWDLSINVERGAPFVTSLLQCCTRDEVILFIDPLTEKKGALIVKMLANQQALEVVDSIWSGLVPEMRQRLMDTLDPKLFAAAQELSDIAKMADANPNSCAAIIFREMYSRNVDNSPQAPFGGPSARDRFGGREADGQRAPLQNAISDMFGGRAGNLNGNQNGEGRVRRKRWDEAMR